MGRRADPYQVRCSQIDGALAGIRDALMLDRDVRLTKLRSTWPQLAERLEAAVELAEPDRR